MKNQYKNHIKKLLQMAFIVMILIFVIQLTFTGCQNENKIRSEDITLLQNTVSKTNANWQLFIDDYWILESSNVTATLHQPEKHSDNPLIPETINPIAHNELVNLGAKVIRVQEVTIDVSSFTRAFIVLALSCTEIPVVQP